MLLKLRDIVRDQFPNITMLAFPLLTMSPNFTNFTQKLENQLWTIFFNFLTLSIVKKLRFIVQSTKIYVHYAPDA